MCSVGIIVFAAEELPKDGIVTAGKAELPKAKSVWVDVTHGFLTPFGFMCQPAR
jgi:hypothetical protein